MVVSRIPSLREAMPHYATGTAIHQPDLLLSLPQGLFVSHHPNPMLDQNALYHTVKKKAFYHTSAGPPGRELACQAHRRCLWIGSR